MYSLPSPPAILGVNGAGGTCAPVTAGRAGVLVDSRGRGRRVCVVRYCAMSLPTLRIICSTSLLQEQNFFVEPYLCNPKATPSANTLCQITSATSTIGHYVDFQIRGRKGGRESQAVCVAVCWPAGIKGAWCCFLAKPVSLPNANCSWGISELLTVPLEVIAAG
jgi:hypothetical protein